MKRPAESGLRQLLGALRNTFKANKNKTPLHLAMAANNLRRIMASGTAVCQRLFMVPLKAQAAPVVPSQRRVGRFSKRFRMRSLQPALPGVNSSGVQERSGGVPSRNDTKQMCGCILYICVSMCICIYIYAYILYIYIYICIFTYACIFAQSTHCFQYLDPWGRGRHQVGRWNCRFCEGCGGLHRVLKVPSTQPQYMVTRLTLLLI